MPKTSKKKTPQKNTALPPLGLQVIGRMCLGPGWDVAAYEQRLGAAYALACRLLANGQREVMFADEASVLCRKDRERAAMALETAVKKLDMPEETLFQFEAPVTEAAFNLGLAVAFEVLTSIQGGAR